MADTLTTLGAYSAAGEKLLYAYPDWTAVGSETAGTTTATATALAGRQRAALWAVVSFSAAPAGAIVFQLKDGSTVIFQAEIPASATAPILIPLRGLRATQGVALSATMGSAGGSTVGTIALAGVTLRQP